MQMRCTGSWLKKKENKLSKNCDWVGEKEIPKGRQVLELLMVPRHRSH